MAEQTLSELVMNLINWIESLHEKNLKYEAQVETLSRDLAKAQVSNTELEARLSAFQNSSPKSESKTSPQEHSMQTIQQQPQQQQQQQQSQQQEQQQQQQHHHNAMTAVPVTDLASTHFHPTQAIYQPLAGPTATFAAQPTPYLWTAYETNLHDPQIPYTYEQYGTPAFTQQP